MVLSAADPDSQAAHQSSLSNQSIKQSMNQSFCGGGYASALSASFTFLTTGPVGITYSGTSPWFPPAAALPEAAAPDAFVGVANLRTMAAHSKHSLTKD
jgi:hypothetical protein